MAASRYACTTMAQWLTIDASRDGGPHEREQKIEAKEGEAGHDLAGARQVIEEAEVGEEAERKQLWGDGGG